MIRKQMRFLFTNEHPFANPLDRQRAQTVITFNWIIFLVWLGWALVFGLPAILSLSPPSVAISAITLGVTPVVFYLAKMGQLRAASALLISAMVTIVGVVLYFLPQIDPRFILIVILPLALASVLTNRAGIIAVGALLAVLMFLTGLLNAQVGAEANIFAGLAQLILIIGLATVILSLFSTRQQRITETSLTDFKRLRSIVETVTRLEIDDTPEDVLRRTIRFLRDEFRYDIVQIYLLDHNRQFSQRLRSGQNQIEAIKQSEQFRLGDTSAIAEAARLQRVIIARADSKNRSRHLLPSIQQGTVIPLYYRGKPLGVIDLQSVVERSIADEEVQLITLLAEELGTILTLLRHIETQAQQLTEQENVANRLQTQLAEIQARQRQVIGSAWGDYIRQAGENAIGFNFQGGRVQQANDMPPRLRQALERGDVFQESGDNQTTVYIPIKLRDDVLGAMSFTLDADQPVTERQLELLNNVALRLGSALESTRLLEQTQAQAVRERKANEVASLLITATDVNALLQLAADSFNNTMGAVQTKIHIEPNLSPSPAPHSNGDSA